MGLFSQDETVNQNTDARQAATDQGINIGGGSNTALGGFGSATGNNQSNIVGPASLGVAGNANSTISVTTADPALLQQALAAYQDQSKIFQETLGDLLTHQDTGSENLSELVQAQGAQSQSLLKVITDKLAELSESKQTGGESLRNNIALYITLAALALIAFVLWRRR